MDCHLPSFDGQESVNASLLRPDRYRHLFSEINARSVTIPRGSGLTYCGASAGSEVCSVSNERFNRILEFDATTGRILVETGLQLGELYRFAAARGWQMPILPGHPSITVGGCIGCNVHGKNHYRDGTFLNVVESLTIYHPDHGEFECSRDCRPEVFNLTVGGFGWTGFITSARLRLSPLTSNSVRIRKTPVADPVEAVEQMEARSDSDLLYSWHNFNRGGRGFGRGFVYTGSNETIEASSSAPAGAIQYLALSPQWRSRFSLGRLSSPMIRAAMEVYGLGERCSKGDRVLTAAAAAFPINGKEIYFRLFGKRGFREYQVLFPRAAWSDAIGAVGEAIRRFGLPIGLASLKLFRSKPGYLRFDGDGVCLAVDTPACDESLKLFAELDAITLAYGGIANISKDSRLSAEVVARMYPEYERFKSDLARFDPNRRFDSALRRRLDV